MKRALITGITGQDGAYLAELLLEKGYEVYGAFRRNANLNTWRLEELQIEKKVKMISVDLLEFTNIFRTIEKIVPDEIYNLAAQSFVEASFEQPILTAEINAIGALRVLECIRTINPSIKFYQASTSEMFGKVREIPQTESTFFYPRSPYGVSKLFAHWLTVNYRESYNIYACSGILFNHESPLRGLEFVTRKITDGLAKIKSGKQDKIVLGNLDSKRDWGFAKDYVEAMWLMLQQRKPDDYVVATGEAHTIREFVEKAFEVVDINISWTGNGMNEKGIDLKTGKVLVEVSKQFFRPAEVDLLVGNPKKIEESLGWKPKVKFNELVKMMALADLKRNIG